MTHRTVSCSFSLFIPLIHNAQHDLTPFCFERQEFLGVVLSRRSNVNNILGGGPGTFMRLLQMALASDSLHVPRARSPPRVRWCPSQTGPISCYMSQGPMVFNVLNKVMLEIPERISWLQVLIARVLRPHLTLATGLTSCQTKSEQVCLSVGLYDLYGTCGRSGRVPIGCSEKNAMDDVPVIFTPL